MEKEIINQFVNQFSQFKNQQLMISIIAFLLFTIITILQTIYTSRLIERYKNQLKKAELKFSVFNEIQITKLSELYTVTQALKAALAGLYGTLQQNENKVDLNRWQSCYSQFDELYSCNKYIVPKTIKKIIDSNIKLLITYNSNIKLFNEKLKLVNNDVKDITNDDRLENLKMIDNEILGFDFKKSTLELMIVSETVKIHIEEYFDNIN